MPSGRTGSAGGTPCVDGSDDASSGRASAAGALQHSPSADAADELETEYRIEQSVHLVGQLPTLIIGNSFAALSGFLFSVDYLPRWQSLTWLAIPVLTAPMLLNWLKLRRAPRPRRVSHRRIRVATIHSGLLGIVWVAVTMGALPQVPTLNQLGLIFGLIVLSMGAVASISALPLAALAYFIPMMTLAFVGTLVRGTLPYKPVALLSGFLFIALIAFLRQNVATFRRSVLMIIEQRRLAEQRAAEVQRRTLAEQEMRVAKEAAEQAAEELRAMHRRLQTELDAARALQLGILPRTFPAWSLDRPVDVHAVMEPAREVGGDLYDCFYAADDLFCFMVGDVSGKGAPAAMFMARTSGLIRLAVRAWQEARTANSSYASVAQTVNRELCQNNAERMFVTLFLGFLDFRSGSLSYINAGHPQPYLLRANGRSRCWRASRKGRWACAAPRPMTLKRSRCARAMRFCSIPTA